MNSLASRQVSYSCLKPPCLSVDATAVAGVRIQDQSVHDASVRSAWRRGRRNEFPLLSCLAGLVLIKVDDLDSHQGLYKGGSFLDEEDRSGHGGLYGVVTYFTGLPECGGTPIELRRVQHGSRTGCK